jgi:hypothetical protein
MVDSMAVVSRKEKRMEEEAERDVMMVKQMVS